MVCVYGSVSSLLFAHPVFEDAVRSTSSVSWDEKYVGHKIGMTDLCFKALL